MGRYTVIKKDTFDTIQLDAGVLLDHFDIEEAAKGNLGFTDDDIITATSGGVNPTCVPQFSDLGADVDNVPVNMKELKHLDSWTCALATSTLGTSGKLIKYSLGCADIDPETGAIVPRADLSQDDFKDIWWVGDKANSGFVAIQIKNALSTGGFSLQTTKNGKGKCGLTLTGHVSIDAQKEVPMVFYSIDPDEPVPVVEPDIVLDKANITLAEGATATIKATTTPKGETVTWSSDDDNIASVDENGEVTAVAEGTATITATITVDENDYSDTCAVTVNAVSSGV